MADADTVDRTFASDAALLAETPAALLPTVCYLCQGLIAPEFAGVDLGLAEKLAVRALAIAGGTDTAQVAALVREAGDLGQVAERLLAVPVARAAGGAAGLQVTEVVRTLREIAVTEGAGSQGRKLELLAGLLGQQDMRVRQAAQFELANRGAGSIKVFAAVAADTKVSNPLARLHAIWGLGQAMFSKCIVVVDEEVNVQDVHEVAWKALNNIDPERDIQFVLGPVDSLDHSSRMPNYGSKMGIDATRKWKEEGFMRPWPDVIEMPAEVKQRVSQLWKKAGLG